LRQVAGEHRRIADVTSLLGPAMKSALRLSLAMFFIVALGAVAACGGSSNTASSSRVSSSAKASPSAGSSKLDPEVAMPTGFPADVPIYPGARLTAAASFTASGQTTWGMEWETLDSIDKVQAFFSSKLSQGDWTTQFSGTAKGSFSAIFSRKSNAKFAGILGADGSSGLTKISLSLAG
jgi:hypothetical protein